ncbi:4-(cytidine 5'-diphospho)-2-C-methyl-D-erythritol kinase [candidate division KSB1 bacterium]
MEIFAPAKINFGLSIGTKQEDGYHPISSIFLPVSLYDKINIKLSGKSGIDLITKSETVPCDQTNLCWKAADLFIRTFNIDSGIRIELEKNIPVGAGLGGGSSDAAAVLSALNNLTGNKITTADIRKTAKELGADVPFFIDSTPAAVSGIGEIIEPAVFNWDMKILLAAPDFEISTKEAYSAFDSGIDKKRPLTDYSAVLSSLRIMDEFKERVINDFESVLFDKYSDLRILKNKLYDTGADYVSLTGSGSVVYGMFAEKETAKTAESQIRKDCKTYLTDIIK